MDDENVSDDARRNRSFELVLSKMRSAIAWRRDSIYKAIMTTLKEERFRKHMSYQRVLKHVIYANRFKLRKKLALTLTESKDLESDDDAENRT